MQGGLTHHRAQIKREVCQGQKVRFSEGMWGLYMAESIGLLTSLVAQSLSK